MIMTDKPKRTRKPPTPARAVDKLAALRSTYYERRAAFIAEAEAVFKAAAVRFDDIECVRVNNILDPFTVEQREAIEALAGHAKEPEDAGFIRDDETAATEDSVSESLPRGALPYVAGEAAKASARGKR
jgi:hypothetical protein